MSNQQKNPMEIYWFPPSEEDMVHAESPTHLLEMHDLPEPAKALTRFLIIFFLFMVVFLIAIPWRQTSNGSGRVIAYLPQDRVQNVHASVSGRIKQWFVKEGTFVKKGDPILEMVDIDPQFFERLKLERDAAQRQYEAAIAVSKTAKIDMERQTDLFSKGISSRRDMEQAIISYKNAQSNEAQNFANFTQAESKLSKQQSQVVTAATDGTIVRLLVGTSSTVVEQGKVVAIFVPKSDQLSVELFVPGNDLPLVFEGRKVRLQFEGWPAVQFSGWPSVAIGTFGGVVANVDQSANSEGYFRVIVVPGPKERWPEGRFIRQGTRVNGWVLLNNVSLGYEIWRQFNGFPPSMGKAPTELENANIEIPE